MPLFRRKKDSVSGPQTGSSSDAGGPSPSQSADWSQNTVSEHGLGQNAPMAIEVNSDFSGQTTSRPIQISDDPTGIRSASPAGTAQDPSVTSEHGAASSMPSDQPSAPSLPDQPSSQHAQDVMTAVEQKLDSQSPASPADSVGSVASGQSLPDVPSAAPGGPPEATAADVKLEQTANPGLTGGNVGAVAAGNTDATASGFNSPSVATAALKTEDMMSTPAQPADDSMMPVDPNPGHGFTAADTKLEAAASPSVSSGNVGAVASGETAVSAPSITTSEMKTQDMMASPSAASAPSVISAPSSATAAMKTEDMMATAPPVNMSPEPTPPPVSGLTSSPDTTASNVHTPGMQIE